MSEYHHTHGHAFINTTVISLLSVLHSCQLGVITKTGLPSHPYIHSTRSSLPRRAGLSFPGHGLFRGGPREEVQPVWPQVWQQDSLSPRTTHCELYIAHRFHSAIHALVILCVDAYVFCTQTEFCEVLQLMLTVVQLEALEYLHMSEFAHGDIKGSNLLTGLHPSQQHQVQN